MDGASTAAKARDARRAPIVCGALAQLCRRSQDLTAEMGHLP